MSKAFFYETRLAKAHTKEVWRGEPGEERALLVADHRVDGAARPPQLRHLEGHLVVGRAAARGRVDADVHVREASQIYIGQSV